MDIAGDAGRYQTDAQGNVVLKADGTPAKKRGRPPKSVSNKSDTETKAKVKNKSASGKSSDRAINMLAAQFQLLNMTVAYVTRFDDFKLDDDEATQLAQATANVMAEFDYTPDPRVTAVMGLVTTVSMIYGPRIYLYRKSLAKDRETKQEDIVNKADERAAFEYGGLNMSGGVFN